eukprot:3940481-Rhodomonas_salina.13
MLQYRASHPMCVARCQHTVCEYRTSHSRRVGRYGSTLACCIARFEKPLIASDTSWVHQSQVSTGHRLASYDRPVPSIAMSAPGIAQPHPMAVPDTA